MKNRVLPVVLALAASLSLSACKDDPVIPATAAAPAIKHVFIVVLENQAYDNTFGASLPVPYLAQTVAAQGALLQNYYGTSHFSLGNYLSLVSGEAVTTANQDDCSKYVDIAPAGMAQYDEVQGSGCIYPAATLTVADQLTRRGFTWRGYMEDMGNDPTREQTACGQPAPGIGGPDTTNKAQVPPNYKNGGTKDVTDQYAARHNPFVYFHSVLDSGACKTNVVPLSDATLPADLASVETTANYTFITPNLCNDGHDVPCKAPGSPRTYASENAFLQKWIPMIVHSPAFQQDGLLIVTFDESSPSPDPVDGSYTVFDGTACCNEPSGPNTTLPGVPPLASTFHIAITGGVGNSGGGRTGAVLVSPFIRPGTVSTVGYNHYATLHAIEDYFGLSYLGYAAVPGTTGFGPDVFGSAPARYAPQL